MTTADDMLFRLATVLEGDGNMASSEFEPAPGQFAIALARLRSDPDEQARLDRIAERVAVEDEPISAQPGRITANPEQTEGQAQAGSLAIDQLGAAGPEDAARRSRVKRILLWCSGANQMALRLTPSEEVNHVGLGGAVLTTAIVSGLAATIALSIALHTTWWIVLPVGLVWSLMIFNLDRWLVATAGGTSLHRRLVNLLPRLVLATGIALLISEPLMLGVFAPEVRSRAAQIQTEDASRSLAQLDSQYSLRLDPIDRQIAAERERVNVARTEVSNLQGAAAAELAGTAATGRAGPGSRYLALQSELAYAESNLASVQRDVDASQTALVAQKNQLTAQQLSDSARAVEAATSRDGLLLRTQALNSLSSSSSSVQVTVWVLRLLIILVDTMPIVVRLLQSLVARRPYDQVVGALQYGEELQAERLRERALRRLQSAKEEVRLQARISEEKAEIEAQLRLAEAEYLAQEQFDRMWSRHGG